MWGPLAVFQKRGMILEPLYPCGSVKPFTAEKHRKAVDETSRARRYSPQ